MQRLLGALLCALMLACGLGQAAHAAPQICSYGGNGPDGVAAIAKQEAALGRKFDCVLDFLPSNAWEGNGTLLSDAQWAVPAWKGRHLVLALPLTVSGTSLADVAAGKHDATFAKVFQLLVANGQADADVRLGWEQNLGNPWAIKGHESDFNAAFRHVVLLGRAQPGAKFRFWWNPVIYMNQQWPDAAYPGDDVVDGEGLDAYNQGWSGGFASNVASEPTAWGHVYGDSWGVNNIIAFAQKHGKPYAFPEMATGSRPDGHGGGDDPYYVQQMAKYAAGATFIGYWNYTAGDYDGALGHFPKTLVAFNAAWPVASATPAAQVAAKPFITCSADGGATCTPTGAQDGSGTLALSFPKTARSHHYTIWLSTPRQVETWGRMSQLGWDTTGGTATVHVGAS